MYLRLVQFTLSADGKAHAQEMAGDLAGAIAEQPGCAGVAFFGAGEDGDSGLCVLWDSEEHASAASAIIGPRLSKHLAGRTTGSDSRRLFPVLAAKING